MDKILANAVTASVVPGQTQTDTKRKLDQIRDLPQNSTVPLSEEDSQGAKMLEAFSVDISHQEVERIIIELEEIYRTQPGEWLPIYGIGSILANDLGYEDEDEFEDALKSTFEEFVNKLPMIECKDVESELQPGLIRKCWRLIPELKAENRRPRCLKLALKVKSDLWRILMRAPGSSIEIPEIEFYAGGDIKRQIDSVYNHLSQACFNLESHVQHMASCAANPEEQQGIIGTIERLRRMLDLDEPCTMVIRCPTGETAFKPMDGIEVLPFDAPIQGTVLMTDDRQELEKKLHREGE
jgi:mediator of RNA polymerase II transcription subunit 31